MRSGLCVKCGAEDVYKVPERSYRGAVPGASLFNQPILVAYVCCTCGYMEEYVGAGETDYFQRIREKGEKVAKRP